MKRENEINKYQNMSEESRQTLKEYQENYREAKQRNKKPWILISIDKVKTKRIVISEIIHIVIKFHLNNLLDI